VVPGVDIFAVDDSDVNVAGTIVMDDRFEAALNAVNGAIRVGEPGARNTGFITRVPR